MVVICQNRITILWLHLDLLQIWSVCNCRVYTCDATLLAITDDYDNRTATTCTWLFCGCCDSGIIGTWLPVHLIMFGTSLMHELLLLRMYRGCCVYTCVATWLAVADDYDNRTATACTWLLCGCCDYRIIGTWLPAYIIMFGTSLLHELLLLRVYTGFI